MIARTIVAPILSAPIFCAAAFMTVQHTQAAAQTATNEGAEWIADLMPGFADWRRAFRGRALVQGVSPATFDAAFEGLQPDPGAIVAERESAEEARPAWVRLGAAITPDRIEAGREHLATLTDRLGEGTDLEGVPPEILTALWGLRSGYGADLGEYDVIRALATLAAEGRHPAVYEAQLVAALRILDLNPDAPRPMRGGWNGAMGHTKLSPTGYIAHGTATGGGMADVWSDDPADALATSATLLSRSGWQADAPWAMEVILPDDLSGVGAAQGDAAEWADLGVTAAGDRDLPASGQARLVRPAGAGGPAFLTFDNAEALASLGGGPVEALAIGLLADRIAGAPPFAADWPEAGADLDEDDRRDLQRRLTAAGFDTYGVDGQIGPNSRAAIRAYQSASGMVADGVPSRRLLEMLTGS